MWIDYLYPKRCPVCLDVLPPGDRLICEPCKKKIRYVSGPTCYRCGKPLNDETREYCRNCEGRRPPFEKGIAYAEYSSKYIRRMLSEVKYHGDPQLLDYPCMDFAERTKETVRAFQAEALVPVPVHRKRRKERGYNQAEEIAERLSAGWEIPVDTEVLFRTENTKAQKELTKEDREKNLRAAFQAGGPRGKYRSVILIDDIYTTGSTIRTCAEALHRNGISTVYFAVLAIGRDR